jgi:hypothetical protein
MSFGLEFGRKLNARNKPPIRTYIQMGLNLFPLGELGLLVLLKGLLFPFLFWFDELFTVSCALKGKDYAFG